MYGAVHYSPLDRRVRRRSQTRSLTRPLTRSQQCWVAIVPGRLMTAAVVAVVAVVTAADQAVVPHYLRATTW